MRLCSSILALMLVSAWPLSASAADQYAGSGEVSYTLIHKFHEVIGTSHRIEARLLLDGAGLKLMARAPVSSFETGNSNRDAHALEVVEGERYPQVVVKGFVPGFKAPTTPGLIKVPVTVEIDLHGVTVNRAIEIDVDPVDSTHFKASFNFPESLTAHKIERPSLLFVPVDDELKIRGSLLLEKKP